MSTLYRINQALFLALQTKNDVIEKLRFLGDFAIFRKCFALFYVSLFL